MESESIQGRWWAWVVPAAAVGVPALVLRAVGIHLDPIVAAVVFGIGIVAGAFLLSWGAEVAQMDISASLAIAVLALIAILPEYAIEAVLAWDAGQSFDPATGQVTDEMQRVAANVTGSNRLLIGLGWAAVVLIFWVKRRSVLDVRGYLNLETTMLLIATAGTFVIYFMEKVHIVMGVSLIGLYAYYLWRSSKAESVEPDLIGPAAMIGALPAARRRTAVVVLFLFSALVIIAAAEPFVEALIETGGELGIDDFILIQWIAPLASESPEIIVAVLFSLRANPLDGITTLISASVNQLTVLIGSMVIIFSLSAGDILNFDLDDRQSAEFLLTAAVSVLALVLVASRRLTWHAGALLLGLFLVHLPFTETHERIIFTFIYLAVAVIWIAMKPATLRHLIKGPPAEPDQD